MSKTVWIYQESNRPGLDHVSIHKSKEAALAAALVSVVLWEEHAVTREAEVRLMSIKDIDITEIPRKKNT